MVYSRAHSAVATKTGTSSKLPSWLVQVQLYSKHVCKKHILIEYNDECYVGIGVTPYASILNDLVFGTSTNRYSGVACKKVKEIFLIVKVSFGF